jgi:hypothetical protein
MSGIGQNMLFLMRRYNCSRYDLLNASANNIIKSCVVNSFDENMYCSANFLYELIMIRNNRLCLGQYEALFSSNEVQCIIDFHH